MLQVGDRVLRIKENTMFAMIGDYGTVVSSTKEPNIFRVNTDLGQEFETLEILWLRMTIRSGDKIVRITDLQPNGCSLLGHEIVCPNFGETFPLYVNMRGNKACFQIERWQRVEVAQFYKEQELMNKEGTPFIIWTTEHPETPAAAKITFELKEQDNSVAILAKHPDGAIQLIGKFSDGKFNRQTISRAIAQKMGIELDALGKIQC